MRLWQILSLAAVACFGSEIAHARRMAPKAVRPVVAAGIRYQAPHFGALHGKDQNGGFVQAWDLRKKTLLWDRMVYRIHYDRMVETDVQDVFITRLRIEGTKLLVTNERNERFEMDLPSGSVRALTDLGEGRSVGTEKDAAGGRDGGAAPEPNQLQPR